MNSSNMEKIRMSPMGLTTSLSRYSKKTGSLLYQQGKSICQTKGVKMYYSETPQVETSSR
jgi:hypothetical protein